MPIRIECDGGCGATCERESEFTEFGHFKKKLYCSDCSETVAGYYTTRDVLHDHVARKWKSAVSLMQTAWCDKHEGGSLPDG